MITKQEAYAAARAESRHERHWAVTDKKGRVLL